MSSRAPTPAAPAAPVRSVWTRLRASFQKQWRKPLKRRGRWEWTGGSEGGRDEWKKKKTRPEWRRWNGRRRRDGWVEGRCSRLEDGDASDGDWQPLFQRDVWINQRGEVGGGGREGIWWRETRRKGGDEGRRGGNERSVSVIKPEKGSWSEGARGEDEWVLNESIMINQDASSSLALPISSSSHARAHVHTFSYCPHSGGLQQPEKLLTALL